MKSYRVQVLVAVDVEADTPGEAMSNAIEKAKVELRDGTHPESTTSVTGIAACGPEYGHTAIYGYLVFEVPRRRDPE